MKKLLFLLFFLVSFITYAQVHTLTGIVFRNGTPNASTSNLDDFLLVQPTGEVVQLDLSSLAARINSELPAGNFSQEEIEDIVGTMMTAGVQSNITITYDDLTGTMDFVSTPYTDEQVEDVTGALISGSNGVTATYDDVAGTLIISLTAESYTSVEKSKLAGIENNATADQTGAEIKIAYEAEANTNAFTDAEQSKLAGIEAAAKDDQTASEVPIVDLGLLIAATNVEDALQELADAIANLPAGGGGSTSLLRLTEAEYLALPQAQKDTLDAVIYADQGFALEASDVSYDNTTSGIAATDMKNAIDEIVANNGLPVADIGNSDKTLLTSDFGRINYTDDSIILTLDNSPSTGARAVFQPIDVDSTITIVPDTGVTILGNGSDIYTDGVRIDSLNSLTIVKLFTNTYGAYGYGKPYASVPPNLYDNSNAINPTNEANSLGNIGFLNDAPSVVAASGGATGSYMVQTDLTGTAQILIPRPSTVTAGTYTMSLDVSATIANSNSQATLFLSTGDEWTVQQFSTSAPLDGTWTTLTITGTIGSIVDGNSGRLRVYVDTDATTGDTLIVDNIIWNAN